MKIDRLESTIYRIPIRPDDYEGYAHLLAAVPNAAYLEKIHPVSANTPPLCEHIRGHEVNVHQLTVMA